MCGAGGVCEAMETGSLLAGLRINFNQRARLAGFITLCVAVWDLSGSILEQSAKYHTTYNLSDPVYICRAGQDYHSSPSWGSPPKPFDDARPVFITVQGQHRFAVFNAICGRRMGLPNHRDGAAGDMDLFPEDGELV